MINLHLDKIKGKTKTLHKYVENECKTFYIYTAYKLMYTDNNIS